MSELVDIGMPRLSDSMEEATVAPLAQEPGDSVARGEPLVEVETDKATAVYEAELDGVLEEIVAAEGETVALGAVIARVRPAGRRNRPPRRAGAATRPRPPARAQADGTEIELREAVRQALDEELERDERVIFFGEDVAIAGGVFAVTPGLHEKYGPRRVFDTPISELAMTGAAYGAAISGLRPVLEIMFGDFLALSMDSIINQMTKYWFLTGETQGCPVVIRSVVGAGGRFGAIHSQMPASWLTGITGLKIAAPATPADAKGLLKAAIRDDNPVVFLEHKRLYPMKGAVDERAGAARAGAGRARGIRRHSGQRDEGSPRLPGGRRAARGRGGERGGPRPAHAPAARRRGDPRLGRKDEPDRGRRGGAAHRRVGGRGACARDRARARRPRRRMANRDAQLAHPVQPAPRGRVPARSGTDRRGGSRAAVEAVRRKIGATAVAERPRFRSFALSRDRNPRSGILVLRTNGVAPRGRRPCGSGRSRPRPRAPSRSSTAGAAGATRS